MSRLNREYQPFRFKQFTVDHNLCSMKVGVDGVLLGAWVNTINCNHILDVGTGSGVIALMLAQKNSAAHITAIDIEKNACRQAEINFENSLWKNRLTCLHNDFLKHSFSQKFDLVVCNPPYFLNSTKSNSENRNLARHNDSLLLIDFLTKASSVLNENGKIAFVYPHNYWTEVEQEIKKIALHVKSLTFVKPTASKPPKRILVEVTKNTVDSIFSNELSIELSSGIFSNDYVSLTKDYYLKF